MKDAGFQVFVAQLLIRSGRIPLWNKNSMFMFNGCAQFVLDMNAFVKSEKFCNGEGDDDY